MKLAGGCGKIRNDTHATGGAMTNLFMITIQLRRPVIEGKAHKSKFVVPCGEAETPPFHHFVVPNTHFFSLL